ncbi:MAG: M50 family metallopeptidase [Pyrinomonadaceae bacterium]|nr:M50 family metallopeptidase [Pyrinomonadaceae bacterium]
MQYRIAKDAEPQFTLLLIATIVSVLLWVASWYIPLVGYVVYPLRLFATFIHEGGHALATILTGNSVQSLTVSPDGSGEVYSLGSGLLSGLLISSAGYLGTTVFGAGLLAWIRYGFSSRIALYVSAGFVAVMTVIFGFLAPVWNLFATSTVGGLFFTIISGVFLAAALAAIAKFASLKWANFALAFVAVQCLLNAVFDLLNVFFISATTTMHSDAANMAAATGIPGFVWVLVWMVVSIFMISVGLRVYAVSKNRSSESVFED